MSQTAKAKAAATFFAIKSRYELEAEYGQVWSQEELDEDFANCLNIGPLALVIRRSDCAGGTIAVQDMPRFYHSFVPF